MFKTCLGIYFIACSIAYIIVLVNSIVDGEDTKGTFLIYGKVCLAFSVFYWAFALGLNLIGLI